MAPKKKPTTTITKRTPAPKQTHLTSANTHTTSIRSKSTPKPPAHKQTDLLSLGFKRRRLDEPPGSGAKEDPVLIDIDEKGMDSDDDDEEEDEVVTGPVFTPRFSPARKARSGWAPVTPRRRPVEIPSSQSQDFSPLKTQETQDVEIRIKIPNSQSQGWSPLKTQDTPGGRVIKSSQWWENEDTQGNFSDTESEPEGGDSPTLLLGGKGRVGESHRSSPLSSLRKKKDADPLSATIPERRKKHIENTHNSSPFSSLEDTPRRKSSLDVGKAKERIEDSHDSPPLPLLKEETRDSPSSTQPGRRREQVEASYDSSPLSSFENTPRQENRLHVVEGKNDSTEESISAPQSRSPLSNTLQLSNHTTQTLQKPKTREHNYSLENLTSSIEPPSFLMQSHKPLRSFRSRKSRTPKAAVHPKERDTTPERSEAASPELFHKEPHCKSTDIQKTPLPSPTTKSPSPQAESQSQPFSFGTPTLPLPHPNPAPSPPGNRTSRSLVPATQRTDTSIFHTPRGRSFTHSQSQYHSVKETQFPRSEKDIVLSTAYPVSSPPLCNTVFSSADGSQPHISSSTGDDTETDSDCDPDITPFNPVRTQVFPQSMFVPPTVFPPSSPTNVSQYVGDLQLEYDDDLDLPEAEEEEEEVEEVGAGAEEEKDKTAAGRKKQVTTSQLLPESLLQTFPMPPPLTQASSFWGESQ